MQQWLSCYWGVRSCRDPSSARAIREELCIRAQLESTVITHGTGVSMGGVRTASRVSVKDSICFPAPVTPSRRQPDTFRALSSAHRYPSPLSRLRADPSLPRSCVSQLLTSRCYISVRGAGNLHLFTNTGKYSS